MLGMQEDQKRVTNLINHVMNAHTRLNINDSKKELSKLEQSTTDPDFWRDNLKAQQTLQKIARLQARIKPWIDLENDLKDIQGLLSLKDSSLADDLSKQLDNAEKEFRKLKESLKLSGPYDDHDVILSLYAGAGGTDAQDWTQMLLRMYMRWAESHKFEVRLIEESAGDEAGIKSATVEISGNYAYGKLKGEHGIHRLVRLSPFNSDSLRQTSFSKVDVLPKVDEPEQIIIDDKEIKIDVYRSSGKGGQSVNTTDSAVRVTHLPTGIVVAIQNERSQLQNKETAMTILRSRLAQMSEEQHAEKISELKGPSKSAEWGNQIRSYVLHPYKQVKDLRTKYESSDPDKVLNGELDPFIEAFLETQLG